MADKTFLTFGIMGVLDLLVLVDAVAPHGIAVLIELHVPNVLSLYTCNQGQMKHLELTYFIGFYVRKYVIQKQLSTHKY